MKSILIYIVNINDRIAKFKADTERTKLKVVENPRNLRKGGQARGETSVQL